MAATTACGSAGPRSGSGLPFNAPRASFGSRSWPRDPEGGDALGRFLPRNSVERANDAILLADAGPGEILDVNPQAERLLGESGDSGKGADVLLQEGEARIGERLQAVRALSGREKYHPAGLGIRKRAQHDGIRPRENGAGAADPQRQRGRRHEREQGTPPQHAPRIPEVPNTHDAAPTSPTANTRRPNRIATVPRQSKSGRPPPASGMSGRRPAPGRSGRTP